jgi:hypothetical protein
MNEPAPAITVIPWRQLATLIPQFVQWYVQRYGPIPDDDPGMTEARYEELRAEYEKEGR